ncbi:MAG: metallophosphoesterase [Firmicutes bacterium]|nr:metallophosphoesterase [Bacillota bacterium]
MIYITGDTHSEYKRFGRKGFPEQKNLTKDDYVIICGDFGLWEANRETEYWLNWLEERSYTTLFVDGNHENFDLLEQYPVKEWRGGLVHELRPHVLHLMRGQIFELEGKRFFTMGGAASHDVWEGIFDLSQPEAKNKVKWLIKQGRYHFRVLGQTWWPQELPSDEEIAQARRVLEESHWQVDYIITHCAPACIVDRYEKDRLTDFFDEVWQKGQFTHWYCGHYHKPQQMGKLQVLYEDIEELEK